MIKAKRAKKLLTLLLTAAMLPMSAAAPRQQVQANTSALASSYNTNLNYIAYATDVEDQAQTNYCWAYMANAVLESYLMKTSAVSQVNFSEWDMISQLSGGTYAFSDLYTGGNYHQALAYWTRGSVYGPRLESNSSLTDYYVSETAELGRYQRDNQLSKQSYIQNIKNLVVSYGAAGVSVYFTAQDRMAMTKDGAYYYPQEASPGVNHGVTVVGWNDDFAPQWFYNSLTTPHQPTNKGAFLVKNSWGKYDSSSIGGNTGYYWISYDNYFQDAFAVTQVVDRSKLYDYIYETDYRGLYDFASGTSYSQSFRLNGSAQWLTGFSTYVKAGANYRFYLNNQELAGCGGTMAQTGYHTFQLPNPIQVYGSLELRAEVNGNSEAVPIACSASSHVPDSNNVCLKVYTTRTPYGSTTTNPSNPSWNPTTPNYTITGVTLTPQDCTVRAGSSQVFTATVTGYGQPSQRIDWQLSGSSSQFTRIMDNGVLYVGADERSDVLYLYANAYADSTQGASARIEVIRSGSSGTQGSSGTNVNGTTNSGTNITGTPNGTTNSGTNITGTPIDPSNSGTNGTGTNINGSPAGEQSSNINGSTQGSTEPGDEPIRVGTSGKGVYAVWEEDGTAQYTQCTSKTATSISIPATVRIDGEIYEVNVMDDGCIRNQKKVKTLTIGQNVAQIGEEAFYGCKQLKKIKIKSEQIEYIGEDAFRGISSKAIIYVPQSCLTEYRQMIRESGNTSVQVKAY
ncbi:MAG: leucine-rich repeat protein [Eubacterium sp.]|nr:leucine-rich repeat protein [Eubacterium sp.]